MLPLLLALLSCGASQAVLDPRGDCDPVDPSRCLLPFPSSFFLDDDASAPTGYRVAFGPTSLPVHDDDDVQLRPDDWNRKDGFSTLTPILSYLGEVDEAQLPGHTDIGASLADGSLTVLVNADTGERVPHWAELDRTHLEGERHVLVVRPAVILEHDTHYVVGLRGLVDPDGVLLPAPDGFVALRNGLDSDDHDVLRQRERFESVVFPTLEAAGVDRSELQLAWDFHTVSEENALSEARWVMDDARERRGVDGPAYKIDEVQEHDCSDGGVGRTLWGTFTAPLYVDSEESPARFRRDAEGTLQPPSRTKEVEFLARVPCSLLAHPAPSPILQYGHGLLGNKDEAEASYLSHLIDEEGWVLVATSWDGLRDEDVGPILVLFSTDASDFAAIPERSLQGMTQASGLLHLATTGLADDPNLIVDGVHLIDPNRRYFYGNSLGGIYGAAYVSMEPMLERGAYGVVGTPFSLLLPRSINFDGFRVLLQQEFEDERDLPILLGLFDMLWEPAQAGGWLHVTDKPALMQVAIGDPQVSTLGAGIMARTLGANTVAPETRPVWGVSEAEPGFSGSALVEWYYPDVAEEPAEAVPVDDENNPHGRPRREPEAIDQLRDFLVDGVVNQYCDGVCER